MPPTTPAAGGPNLPPISNDAIVDGRGFLTMIGLNLFQQLWAGVFGTGGIVSQTVPPGTLASFAGGTVPGGWLLCDGSAYPETSYQNLFDAIGTTWGSAGVGTFRVPNGQDKLFMGASATHPLGSTGGALSRTILQANLPIVSFPVTDPGHAHTITDPTHHHTGGVSTAAVAGAVAGGASPGSNTGDSATGITINSDTTGITVASGGSGIALDTTPSYFAGNWIIKT